MAWCKRYIVYWKFECTRTLGLYFRTYCTCRTCTTVLVIAILALTNVRTATLATTRFVPQPVVRLAGAPRSYPPNDLCGLQTYTSPSNVKTRITIFALSLKWQHPFSEVYFFASCRQAAPQACRVVLIPQDTLLVLHFCFGSCTFEPLICSFEHHFGN